MKGKLLGVWFTLCALSACGSSPDADVTRLSQSSGSASSIPTVMATKEALGEQLFSDVNLSFNRTQACASCHNPDHAFIDSRLNSNGQVVAGSLGDDGFSLGDRNAPSITYVVFSPDFGQQNHARFNSKQPDYAGFVGGQFWDGRALNLAEQAGAPILDPGEMAMPNKASVIERLQENAIYLNSFRALYGDAVFDDDDVAYAALTDSLAAFESSTTLASFDSKYDRSLRGESVFDPLSKAAQGKALFFSQQFVNCATCHQLRANSHKQETFTSYEYHNIGVPVNTALRAVNGKGDNAVDTGLLNHPQIEDIDQSGKFKVPSLRNIAVTAPYMHNGVFRELKTVIQFYDHYLTDSMHTINPETGSPWAAAEVPGTISHAELEDGNRLSDEEVDALVCFLHTLTDARYENLIPQNGIDCSE